MKFPVDLLADVSQTELERLAHNYMNNLLYSNPDSPEHLALSDSTQVTIDVSSVGFVPLYGSGDKQKILALFSPSDPFTAVALYLLDRWWAVDDILKTADPARDGAVEVETVGERIVLYILNRVVYRAKEMSSEELPFLCHGEKDNAKVLWNNGEAVGFYSVKPSGSFSSSFSTRSYQLPVMDSIFVRKCQRGKGFGLQMLEDFVLSFKEDCLGLRYPIAKFMYKVCEKYLCQYPGDTDLLWEVESIGGPNQRTNIARKIQAMHQSVSKSLSFTEESLVITERTEEDVVMEAIAAQIKQAGSMECTVEIVEEVTLLSATKEAEVPLTARGRSSGSKRRKMGEKIGEDKSDKVIRIEDIEAETPSKDQVSAQQKTELRVSELVTTEGMSSVAPEEQGEHILALRDLREDDVTLAPTTEEPQVEDNAPENLNSVSCDSQITVENVASEIEEECQKEDAAVLAVSEEAVEEAETLDKAGEGTQVGVTDERVTQELSLSTRATSENGEAGKPGRASVKAVTTVQSVTPRRRSTRHSKQEEGVKQGTAAQDAGIILRGRTIRNTPPPTHKYTRRSQKVSEELEKEVDEAAEEEDISTTQVVEESDVAEGEAQEEEQTSIEEDAVTVEELSEEKQQLEDEETIEKQQEPGVEDTELPDTAGTALTKEYEDEIVTGESEKEQNGEEVETPVMQNKTDVPENEIEEPPAEASAGEENTDEQAADKQMEEHHQVEQEGTVDKTEEEITTEELTVVQEGSVPKAKEAAEDVIPLTKEEKQCEVSEICADSEADIPVGDDAEGNLPLVEVDEAMSSEEEEAPAVETRALRRKAKASTATPRHKSARGRKQVDEQEAENSEEEPAVTTRTLRRGRVSTTDTPKGKSKRSRKQIQEEKQKGEEESKCVEETGVGEEDAAKEAAVEKIKEIVDKVKEAASEKVEGLELEIDDVEEGEAVAEQKQDPVEDKTGLGSEPPTEGDEGNAPEEDKIEVENEELVTVEVEKGESEEGTMMLTKEEENTAVVTASADDLVQEETDAPIPSPATDSAVLPPVEDEATPSAEEQQSEETATQLSDLRRVTVVLVDLQKPHHDVQDETAATEEGLTVQKTAAEAEEKQGEETMKEEETAAQENVPGSSVGIENTELEKVTVNKERCEDKVEAVTKQDAEEGRDEETTEAVEATPRTIGRPRKVRQEAASKVKEVVPIVEIRVLRAGRKSYYARQRSTTKRTRKQLQEEEEEEGGEDSTAVEARETEEEEEEQKMTDRKKGENLEERDATEQAEHIEAEMASEKEDIVAEQGQDAIEDQSEGISKTSAEGQIEASSEEFDEIKPSLGAEEVELPAVAATSPLRSGGKMSKASPKTRSRQSKKQSEEEEEELEPPVETTILGRGRKSVRRSHKQLQKEEDGPEESAEVQEEENAGPGSAKEPPTEEDKGNAPEEDKIEVENEELVTVEVDKGESEEGTMMLTEEEENTAVVTASADDLVQEETDAPIPSPATDSAVLPPIEDEATPSAEEQQSEETATQPSDLRRVTVVLVDLQKPHHDVQDETAATEEGLTVQKTAAEAEEEQGEETMKEEETAAQENVPGSSVGIENTELEKVTVNKERCEDKVEAVTKQDAEEGRDEETTEAVKATPRTIGRPRKVRQEAASKVKEVVPIVEIRVLRAGRKSYYARQRSTTKRTRKQLQEEEEEEEEGGEDSTAVEARETEEEEEEQQMTERKKGENLEEGDATEQAEHIEAEMASEKEDIVAESAVDQHDAQEEGQIDCTETGADVDTEVSGGQLDHEENTLVVAEEALAKQDTVEGEQSTSTSEVAESAQETMLTAKVESEEEAQVVERVLRSGEKTVRATTRRKTTKKHDDEQEEEAPGENSTEEDEPAVEIRVPRKGRKPADATPRRKSKRARTQCQTEEEGEEETTPPEQTQVEEAKAVLEETDEKEEEKDDDEDAPPDEGNTEPELCIVAEAVSGESLTEQEAVEETCADGQAEETPNTDEGKVSDEEEAPIVETGVLRSGDKTVRATTRKGRRSAAASPRRKSKRARTQCQQEEAGEEEATPAEGIEGEEEEDGQESSEEKDKDVEEEEARNADGEELTVGDAEQTKDASTEEAGVLEEEDNRVEAVDGIGIDTVLPSSAEEEETAVVEHPTAAAEVVSDAAIAEGEALVEDVSAVAEDEAPAVTTRAFRGKQKASPATPSPRSRRQKDDSPRRSVRKRQKVDYRENNEGEQDEAEGNTDEEKKVTVASDKDQGNEAAGSSQEDEEYSEEEEEPIVIGKRVLRGRSIPSLIITPQSKSRRRSAKVSNEEKSPRSAQKRKSTEVTRKSKRLSRV
ncbi:microtubule-associated protein futsch-like isoform X2 [Cebidichthys violaceus]|uniref:microtubule-associated protein futsch-like isoform X2 n=1 Tax=Cebidichthys violaceus TaxID=271503 RepID=UPI0035CC1BC0